MQLDSKILILGSKGLVGSALVRELKQSGHVNLLTPPLEELDLTRQDDVLEYFEIQKPEYVFLAAAKVGGIMANNTYPADFIFQNLAIQNNTFEAAFKSKVKRLLFLGSSCIYPKECPQPMKEEHLLTSKLEPTNESYAIAKIAGLKMAESFRRQYGCEYYSVMPTNLYGINDNYDKKNAHVIPGMIARMKEAMDKGEDTFEVWGTGTPRREFLYVDDMANACVFIMKTDKKTLESLPPHINIGSGTDVSIKELAFLIKDLLGHKGDIVFNPQYPDGTMKKLLDVSVLKSMGWQPSISLKEGVKKSVEFYLGQNDSLQE